MNMFLSIIFITGTIYIGIFSGCSGKNMDPKEVKENTSDLKKEPSSDQSSSLEKTIEKKDQTNLANKEVKENTSDLKKEPSSDQSSSLEKTIEKKDQTILSNPEASPFLIRGNKGLRVS